MSCNIAHPISEDFGTLYTKSELSFAENVICFIDKLNYGFEDEDDLVSFIQQQESLLIFTYQNIYCVSSEVTQSVLHRIFNITSSPVDMSIIVTDPFGQVQLNLCQNCNNCSDGTPGNGITPVACADIGQDTFVLEAVYNIVGIVYYLEGVTLSLNTGNAVTNWPDIIIGRYNNITYTFSHAGNGVYYINGTQYEMTAPETWEFFISELVVDYSCTITFGKTLELIDEAAA